MVLTKVEADIGDMHHTTHVPRRIAVFRTDRLGDLILTFPVVESLKAAFPNAEVDLVVSPSTAALARLQRNVAQVVEDTYQGIQGIGRLVRTLRSRDYDTAIHVYPRPQHALATFLAGIPVRIGTAYRFYSVLFTHRIKVHRKHMTEHEVDLNLTLVGNLGDRVSPISYGLSIPAHALRAIDRLLAEEHPDLRMHRWVILHPGSGGSSLAWPPEHYGLLGKELLYRGYAVILTGSERDRHSVEMVKEIISNGAIDLCGRLSVEVLLALISKAALLISNSTGPLHLADALGTRVIGLYSPFVFSSPIRWGPYTQRENVLVPKHPPCRRCMRERCKEYNCMALIQPEEVLVKALGLLSEETLPIGQGVQSSPQVQSWSL